jgi:hypothetical protein
MTWNPLLKMIYAPTVQKTILRSALTCELAPLKLMAESLLLCKIVAYAGDGFIIARYSQRDSHKLSLLARMNAWPTGCKLANYGSRGTALRIFNRELKTKVRVMTT